MHKSSPETEYFPIITKNAAKTDTVPLDSQGRVSQYCRHTAKAARLAGASLCFWGVRVALWCCFRVVSLNFTFKQSEYCFWCTNHAVPAPPPCPVLWKHNYYKPTTHMALPSRPPAPLLSTRSAKMEYSDSVPRLKAADSGLCEIGEASPFPSSFDTPLRSSTLIPVWEQSLSWT